MGELGCVRWLVSRCAWPSWKYKEKEETWKITYHCRVASGVSDSAIQTLFECLKSQKFPHCLFINAVFSIWVYHMPGSTPEGFNKWVETPLPWKGSLPKSQVISQQSRWWHLLLVAKESPPHRAISCRRQGWALRLRLGYWNSPYHSGFHIWRLHLKN